MFLSLSLGKVLYRFLCDVFLIERFSAHLFQFCECKCKHVYRFFKEIGPFFLIYDAVYMF